MNKIETNEQWFCSLNTEEKAEALERIIRHTMVQYVPTCYNVSSSERWEAWLKRVHNENWYKM